MAPPIAHPTLRPTPLREALRQIRRGGRIFLGSGCAEPRVLSDGLIEHSHLFSDSSIIHIMTQGQAAYTQPQFADNFRHTAFFIGANVRQAVQEGRADYTPIFLSEIPELFASGRMPIDAALIQVTPPDSQGYCSLGVSVDVIKAAARQARLVIAQVNPQMPRTFGDSFIHLNEINVIVEGDAPIPEVNLKPPDDVAERIGYHVSRLVRDGATLQMGIGIIPNALTAFLRDKNDLGVHSEMISDGIMDLANNGNVTGRRKTLHPNAVVTSFCMGSSALYRWVHENPHVLFFPSNYTNDPGIIRQNDNMVAINSAIAIDLTGQVCADSIGGQFYSGIGGQVDFLRGAARSSGGRPIIALPSTARGGTVSRIMSVLEAGTGVVTSRGDVHYVVTEYGVAYLHGKSVGDRARALIAIAHPDFQDDLRSAARQRHYVYGDFGLSASQPAPYPSQHEHSTTFSRAGHPDVPIFFRPIQPVDEQLLQEFFYSHSEATIYNRYGYANCSMSRQRALSLVQLDYHKRFALIGLTGEAGDEKIAAIGRYDLDEEANLAELSFVIREDLRHIGIATHLLQYLIEVVRAKGFSGVCAQMVSSNSAMQAAFQKVLGGGAVFSGSGGETTMVYRFAIDEAASSASP